MKLALMLGSVFLNKSNASSSFKTLMVSARATSSSARTFLRSSHSAVFSLQLWSKCARTCWSSASAAWVSERSSFIWTICTPNSPIAVVFVSMAAVRACVSLVFAAISSSKVLMAVSSVAVRSAKFLDMLSPISFKMPVISPLFGEYSELSLPDRNESNSWRSTSSMSCLLRSSRRSAAAALVCRKLPAMPFSSAAVALVMASMFASSSAFSLA
mmetsp:Transcript_61864/g.191689  ORF Transcript_61864/g.191689 Transcript_61864/m.191689 type:complete len:214 (+) Transcript_61864:1226-1867(+)